MIIPESFFSVNCPIEPMPSGRQMRAANLWGISELARQYRFDPIAALERHEIEATALIDVDQLVDSKSVVELFEYCNAAFNIPHFGLQLALQQGPEIFGCVTALCRAAPTLRESIQCFVEYIPLIHSPATSLELLEGQSTAELRWTVRDDLRGNCQANYQAVALDLKLLKYVAGPRFRPCYVALSTEPNARGVDFVERILGCRFHRTEGEDAIAFPASELDQTLPGGDRLVYKLLSGYFETVKSNFAIPIVESVHEYVRNSLALGSVSLRNCADALQISMRTLQTKLRESDSSFTAILEDQRLCFAKNQLRKCSISLTDIAFDLGYKDQSSFSRAFRRWTGFTPERFREEGH